MKRILLAALVILLTVDISTAQMSFAPRLVPLDNQKTTLNADDEDDMNRRRRRRSRRGRGGDMGLVVSPQLTLGVPMGDLADQNKMGFGLTVDALYFMDQLGLGVSTGYHTFGWADDAGFASGSQSFIPLLAQGTFIFATSEFKPYAGLGVGVYNVMAKGELTALVPVGIDPVTMEPIYEEVTQDFSENSSDFGLAPLFGFYYTLNDQMNLSGGLRYNMIMTKEEVLQDDFSIKEESKTYSYLTVNFGIAISIK